MNLENLNLVELNAQEVKEVEGGIIPWLIVMAAIYLGGEIYDACHGRGGYGQP